MSRLEIVRWDGWETQKTETDDATPEAVTAAVAAMNGRDLSEVYLHDPSGAWIGLLGGPDRYFVGFLETEEGPPYQALAGTTAAEAMTVIVGGQPTTLESKYLIPRKDAVAAALSFLGTGQQPQSLMWEPQ